MGNQVTFTSYHSHVERLSLWTLIIRKWPILSPVFGDQPTDLIGFGRPALNQSCADALHGLDILLLNGQRMVEQSFREDLYYRLNGLQISLPALRERQDLNTLIDRLRQRYGAPPLEHQALLALHRQAWPGNVRQLEQTLRLAAALASDEPMILLEHLPAAMRVEGEQERRSDLQDAVRRTVESALQANAGNISATASQFGISRTTLYKKLGRITRPE